MCNDKHFRCNIKSLRRTLLEVRQAVEMLLMCYGIVDINRLHRRIKRETGKTTQKQANKKLLTVKFSYSAAQLQNLTQTVAALASDNPPPPTPTPEKKIRLTDLQASLPSEPGVILTEVFSVRERFHSVVQTWLQNTSKQKSSITVSTY